MYAEVNGRPKLKVNYEVSLIATIWALFRFCKLNHFKVLMMESARRWEDGTASSQYSFIFPEHLDQQTKPPSDFRSELFGAVSLLILLMILWASFKIECPMSASYYLISFTTIRADAKRRRKQSFVKLFSIKRPRCQDVTLSDQTVVNIILRCCFDEHPVSSAFIVSIHYSEEDMANSTNSYRTSFIAEQQSFVSSCWEHNFDYYRQERLIKNRANPVYWIIFMLLSVLRSRRISASILHDWERMFFFQGAANRRDGECSLQTFEVSRTIGSKIQCCFCQQTHCKFLIWLCAQLSLLLFLLVTLSRLHRLLALHVLKLDTSFNLLGLHERSCKMID